MLVPAEAYAEKYKTEKRSTSSKNKYRNWGQTCKDFWARSKPPIKDRWPLTPAYAGQGAKTHSPGPVFSPALWLAELGLINYTAVGCPSQRSIKY